MKQIGTARRAQNAMAAFQGVTKRPPHETHVWTQLAGGFWNPGWGAYPDALKCAPCARFREFSSKLQIRSIYHVLPSGCLPGPSMH